MKIQIRPLALVVLCTLTLVCFAQQVGTEELRVWGYDGTPQVVSNLPPGSDFGAIAAGAEQGVALRSNGSIVAWGSDSHLQITNVPSGTDFIQVVAGDNHAVALRSNGSLVSWGNTAGTSGEPTSGTYLQVSAGHNYCLALANDGSIIHWGSDPWSNGLDEVPPGTDFEEISAGYIHALARKTDGSVVGWGANNYGQTALQVETDFRAISGGQYWSLAWAGLPDVVFLGLFETGDFTGWSSVVGASP